MGENSELIQARLRDLPSRFDAMALEVTNLGKQLATTQESVDEVRLKQLEAARSDRPPPSIPPLPDGPRAGSAAANPTPRLANLVPPVLNSPTVQLAEKDI